MHRLSIVLWFALAASPFANAQSILSDWEVDARGAALIVLAPGRDDAGEVDAELAVGEVRAEVRVDRVLENGAKIGFRLGARAQFDHPARSGFSGLIGGEGFALVGASQRGAFTGLTLGGEEEDADVRAALETAFAYIDGGYGELLVGRDLGVARRFHEGAESVFGRHGAINPSLDSSGIASVITRSDLSGPAAKISYSTPRILGLKLGASYAPRAVTRGLDRDPARSVDGVEEPRLEQIVEVGFNFSRRLRASGVRVSTYGAYARADLETGPLRVDTGTVEVWSTGARLEHSDLSFGADWLTTDNGAGRYTAWSVSAGAEKLGFEFSASYGQSDDELTAFEGETGSIGVSRAIFEDIRLGLGVQTQILKSDTGGTIRSTGPVIEMSLSF